MREEYSFVVRCALCVMRKATFLILLAGFIITASGCDAFVRKFTRKPKYEIKEEMVLVPEEYKPRSDKEGVYREYFLYWKSWQDELINAFVGRLNQRKQFDCADEALKNLNYMRSMLKEDKQKALDKYIGQMQDLRDMIKKEIYGMNFDMYRMQAERIKKNLLRDFSYPKVKGSLL